VMAVVVEDLAGWLEGGFLLVPAKVMDQGHPFRVLKGLILRAFVDPSGGTTRCRRRGQWYPRRLPQRVTQLREDCLLAKGQSGFSSGFLYRYLYVDPTEVTHLFSEDWRPDTVQHSVRKRVQSEVNSGPAISGRHQDSGPAGGRVESTHPLEDVLTRLITQTLKGHHSPHRNPCQGWIVGRAIFWLVMQDLKVQISCVPRSGLMQRLWSLCL